MHMVNFDKSRRHDNNYFVENDDGSVIYFNDKEVGDLHRAVEYACDRRTGYGTQKFFNEKSEVITDSDGVTLRSKTSGGWEEMKLSYGKGRQLLGSIEDRIRVEDNIKKR